MTVQVTKIWHSVSKFFFCFLIFVQFVCGLVSTNYVQSSQGGSKRFYFTKKYKSINLVSFVCKKKKNKKENIEK